MESAGEADDDYFWDLSTYKEKLGFPKAASDTLLDLASVSSNLETFVRALNMLERAGRYAESDRLRFRWLSNLSRKDDLTLAFFVDDSQVYTRPEIELAYDRWEKVTWSMERIDPRVQMIRTVSPKMTQRLRQKPSVPRCRVFSMRFRQFQSLTTFIPHVFAKDYWSVCLGFCKS